VYFASPYPYAKLDLVAVAEFGPGGMENVGAIFYRQEKILIDETPSIYQLRGYAYIHAHELAHSWFGNMVTPAWWDDLWLNEAFATWMANRVVHAWRPQEFDDRGPVRGARWAMWSDRLVSARRIRQPIVSDHDIVNAFDSITYSKGGGVLSMVERYMGAETFRAGVRRFMTRHKHGVATAEDFFDALSESAGDRGVMRAFRSFVEQPGTPMLRVDWSCDNNGAAQVSLKQSRGLPLGSKGDAAKRWSIPICLAFPNGEERQRKCVLMTETAMTVPLATAACPAWFLPNEAGAAYLNFVLPDRGWDALIENLDDLQPSEVLSVIGSMGSAYEAGLSTTERVLEAARAVAQSPHWDVARAPMQGLRDVKNFILPKDRRSAALAEMQRIYIPALARFDLSDAGLATDEDNSDLALLRGDLVWFMALDAEEPELRARLSRLGQAYVGYGSDDVLHRDVLHPNLVRVALITAMEEVGLPFAEALIERLRRTDDAVLRNHIIYALGYQNSPALVERVWALILDPATAKRDASQLLRRQGRRADNAEPLLDWIVEHYDALLERLPRRHRAWVVWRLSALCDEADRDRVEAFFAERVKAHRGAPRALANVVEQIELCAAVVDAQRTDAVETIRAPE
jgi:alanyl aminopeptidase